MNIHKLAALCLLAGIVGGTAGCGSYYDYQSGNNFGSQRAKEAKNSARSYQTTQEYGTVQHNNTKLEINQPLIDVVQAMDGVNSAIVALTDRYAYVAITVDNSASGTKGSGAKREVDNSGTSLGMYSPSTGNAPQDPKQLVTGSNSYETAERPEDLSHGFKQAIADKVRLARPDVYDVFISANREFVNQMNVYAQESWKGKSLDPYIGQFNAMVTQIFGTGPTHTPWNANR